MNEQLALYVLKGALTELSQDEQEKVSKCASEIRKLINQYGADGYIALSLVALEVAVEANK